jgi:hypothetical protein
LIVAIPPVPEYDPLPYRENPRQPTIELPPYTNIDLYSLFTLFLIEAHFETIATNTNRYVESKDASIMAMVEESKVREVRKGA